MHPRPSLLAAVPVAFALSSCSSDSGSAAVKPAKTEAIGHETELLRLTLTPEAVGRLAIATVRGAAMVLEDAGPGLRLRLTFKSV
jgi:hypothetical protein